ncbi:MAG: Colicin production protein [Verrucomicrobiales bacterium]|nr:Colicin production protein [Verrucomicrobiales bacterium]
MILWLAALIFLAFPAVLGYRAGAIRAAISLIGLMIGAVLAIPLGPLLKPVVRLCGVQQPFFQTIIAPAAVFLIVVIVFKIIAQAVHQKVELHFEFKANDTMRAKWQRLSKRLGLCVGVLNGAIYFFLLLIPVYIAGYLTTQVATADDMPKSVKILNQARQQLQTTKLDKFVAAHDPAPEWVYDASDIIALVQHNPISVSRLSRYPDFLSLAERPEFQSMSTDAELNDLIQRQASIGEVLKHPKVQAVVTNTELTGEIQRIVVQDLKDLKGFLMTGKSGKYDSQKILGRWAWDRAATVNAEKKKKGFLSPQETQRLNQRLALFYGAQLVAMIDNKLILKHETPATGQDAKIAEGTWAEDSGSYQLSLGSNGPMVTTEAKFADESRISFNYDGLTFFFDKEQ